MRRGIFVLGLLFFTLGLLLSCSRENTLQIVSVNNGRPVYGDLADFGVYRDPTDPQSEPEFVVVTPDDTVEIKLRYTEIGAGLPTWRPYVAHINKVTVTFTGVSGGEPITLPRVESRVNISVTSDPSGKQTTSGYIQLLPATWKEENFGSPTNDPTEVNIEAQLTAKIKLEGVDASTGQTVIGEALVPVYIGDFYDDPTRIGR